MEHRPPLTVAVNEGLIQIDGRYALPPADAIDLANRIVDAAEGVSP